MPANSGWRVYVSKEYKYRVEYPPSWDVEVREPKRDGSLETQSVAISKGTSDVLVAVNLQGDLCIGPYQIARRSIAVSGIYGEEWTCSSTIIPGQVILRMFLSVLEGHNYHIIGEYQDEPDVVRRIVESFEFLR